MEIFMNTSETNSETSRVTKSSNLNRVVRLIALTATLYLGFTSIACETSHTESDTPGLFGGNTHDETTTTHNPITDTNDTTSTETKTP
jgi:hypothetical protein